LVAQGHSISVACRIAGIDRKTYRYKRLRKADDEKISAWLKQTSTQYTDYGFKKLYDMMRAQGMKYNHKRVYRLYCSLKLNLKVKPKKRLAPRTAVKLAQPSQPNECWSLDYMSDALMHGHRFRTANVIDDYNREAPDILVSYRLPAVKVTNWLDRIAKVKGYPLRIRVDNGPENISKHFNNWAQEHGIEIQYIQPGKPAQNAYIERFNRTYRQAVLDKYIFRTLAEAKQLTKHWLEHYNLKRPHDALSGLSPVQFRLQHQNSFL